LEQARAQLRIVEEQLAFQADVVAEARTRMLVSETPLADREHHIAASTHRKLQEERERIVAEMDEVRAEQDRLLDKMLAPRKQAYE
jgi:galactokinase/mevalonate kinase-like predicted kinase